MTQMYARVSGGKFTPIRFTEDHLLFDDTIADIIAAGDKIYPILEPLPNIGTPGSPAYRNPTVREIALEVTDKESLVKEVYSYELGQPMGIATLDSSGDLSSDQRPPGGEEGGGVSSAKLFEVLRNPLTTAEDIESWSNTNDGYACWATLSSIPEIFLEQPIINKIRRCPSVMIAIRKNRDLATLLEPWDVYNFVPIPRAEEIAAMTDAEFTAWVGAEQDATGLVEFSHSTTAMLSIADNEFKMQLIASSAWVLDRIFESKTTVECLADKRLAMRAMFGSQLAVSKINASTWLFTKINTNPESYEELAASPLAMEGLYDNWSLFGPLTSNAAFLTSVAANEESAGWLLCQDMAIPKISTNATYQGIIQNSTIAWDIYKLAMDSITAMCADSRLAPKLISSTTRVEYFVSTKDLVKPWAKSIYSLQEMFSTTEYRIIIFEQGGKDAADVLMREENAAIGYLRSIQSSYRVDYRETVDIQTRAYILQRTAGGLDTNEYGQFGNFIGDYRNGTLTLTGNSQENINERAKPLSIHNWSSSTSEYNNITAVLMGEY